MADPASVSAGKHIIIIIVVVVIAHMRHRRENDSHVKSVVEIDDETILENANRIS